jgi:MoxR-like ATPase
MIEQKQLTVEQVADLTGRVLQEVEKAVVGKSATLRRMMAAFLSTGGHVLLEDPPGLAKTLMATSFATALGLGFKRVQFTPDLLPGDITGGYVFDGNQNRFTLRRGPVFTHVLLADEINRASPKTQSALLEAMQEGQVTLEGETLGLPEPFLVIATQNPIESEGTFPLPEAQLDRFLVKLSVGYPSADEEDEILRRRTERRVDAVKLDPVVTPEDFLAMRQCVETVLVDPDVRRYMVDLVARTREHQKITTGVSPRGSLALLKLARAWAAIQGRAYVLPDDVKEFVLPALAHRLTVHPSLWDVPRSDQNLVGEILLRVPVPVLEGTTR